jgi:hypothetical protein
MLTPRLDGESRLSKVDGWQPKRGNFMLPKLTTSLIIGAVLALGLAAPAKADTITTGTWQVTEVPDGGYILFGFAGGFTDLGPIDPYDPNAFVYSYDVSASVNDYGFFDSLNVGCPIVYGAGCPHHGSNPTVISVPAYLGENLDIIVTVHSNWTNDLALTYSGGILTAVPEPSTWAMFLIGFAGIGAMAHRRRTSRLVEHEA